MLQSDSTQAAIAAKVGGAIDAIAVRLKVPAQFVWRILMKQAYVEFYTDLAVIAFCLLWVILGIKSLLRMIEADRKHEKVPGEGLHIFAIVIGAVACLPLLLYTFFFFGDIGGVINPEYFALQSILSFVSGGTR